MKVSRIKKGEDTFEPIEVIIGIDVITIEKKEEFDDILEGIQKCETGKCPNVFDDFLENIGYALEELKK